jgi:hypothetical protein
MFLFYFFETFLSILKCHCCLDAGGGNKGCGGGNGAPAPMCTVYGTNAAGTGVGTCALSPSPTGPNYDSFVNYILIYLL